MTIQRVVRAPAARPPGCARPLPPVRYPTRTPPAASGGTSTPAPAGQLAAPAGRLRPSRGMMMASAGIRKTPTGRYKVWWRLDDGSQGSQTLDSRDQARDYKHELLAGVARDTWVDPRRGKQPFGDWARQWWETWSSDPDRSPTTLEATEGTLRLHVRPYFEHRQLRAITATAIVCRWQNDRAARGRGTVMAARSILFRILQAAEDERLIVANRPPRAGAQARGGPGRAARPGQAPGAHARGGWSPPRSLPLPGGITSSRCWARVCGSVSWRLRRRASSRPEPPVIQVVATRYRQEVRQRLQGPAQEPRWHPQHPARPPGRRGVSATTPERRQCRRPRLCRSLATSAGRAGRPPLPVPARSTRRGEPSTDPTSELSPTTRRILGALREHGPQTLAQPSKLHLTGGQAAARDDPGGAARVGDRLATAVAKDGIAQWAAGGGAAIDDLDRHGPHDLRHT